MTTMQCDPLIRILFKFTPAASVSFNQISHIWAYVKAYVAQILNTTRNETMQ